MGRKSTGSNPMVLKWAGSPQVPILPGPKGLGAQAFQSHGLEMGRKSTGSNPMVLKWAGSPQVPILQYFQIHRSCQNAWSFSISRFTGPQNACSFSISRYTGYNKMLGPSVFPEKEVIPKWLVLQYFQIHRSSECLVLWCPKYKFRHPTQTI